MDEPRPGGRGGFEVVNQAVDGVVTAARTLKHRCAIQSVPKVNAGEIDGIVERRRPSLTRNCGHGVIVVVTSL